MERSTLQQTYILCLHRLIFYIIARNFPNTLQLGNHGTTLNLRRKLSCATQSSIGYFPQKSDHQEEVRKTWLATT